MPRKCVERNPAVSCGIEISMLLICKELPRILLVLVLRLESGRFWPGKGGPIPELGMPVGNIVTESLAWRAQDTTKRPKGGEPGCRARQSEQAVLSFPPLPL